MKEYCRKNHPSDMIFFSKFVDILRLFPNFIGRPNHRTQHPTPPTLPMNAAQRRRLCKTETCAQSRARRAQARRFAPAWLGRSGLRRRPPPKAGNTMKKSLPDGNRAHRGTPRAYLRDYAHTRVHAHERMNEIGEAPMPASEKSLAKAQGAREAKNKNAPKNQKGKERHAKTKRPSIQRLKRAPSRQ